MKNNTGIDWEDMRMKLEEFAEELGVDLDDTSDIKVIEPPKRIKFKLGGRKPLPEKTWAYQRILARMKFLYKQQTKDLDGWPSWNDFAKARSLYYWVRLHQQQVTEKDDDVLMHKMFGGEFNG